MKASAGSAASAANVVNVVNAASAASAALVDTTVVTDTTARMDTPVPWVRQVPLAASPGRQDRRDLAVQPEAPAAQVQPDQRVHAARERLVRQDREA